MVNSGFIYYNAVDVVINQLIYQCCNTVNNWVNYYCNQNICCNIDLELQTDIVNQ